MNISNKIFSQAIASSSMVPDKTQTAKQNLCEESRSGLVSPKIAEWIKAMLARINVPRTGTTVLSGLCSHGDRT